MSAPLSLSAEQLAVVELATITPRAGGEVTIVTAGAGTGKTTTLKALAEKFNELGRKPTYVTFSKKGAEDARGRLGHRADCRTLDSIAFQMVVKDTEVGEPLMEHSVEKLILDVCGDSIDGLLEPAVELLKGEVEMLTRRGQDREARKQSYTPRRWRRTVGFHIRKTLEQFLHSADSAEVGLDAKQWNTTYYPAKLWHTNVGKERGAPVGVRCDVGDFYVNNAKKVWSYLRPWISKHEGGKGGIRWTYASAFKEMQLRGVQQRGMQRPPGMQLPPGMPILCDESQDMNECQVAWVMQQRNTRSVFFVGDAVQTIYQFRGANVKYMLNVDSTHKRTLTTSYRFGGQFAALANVMLLCKEKCDQKFESYRLVGGGQAPGVILRTCADAACKRTVLAFTNLALLDFAVTTMTAHPDISMSFLRGNGHGSHKRISKMLNLVEKVFKFWMEKISLSELPGFGDGGDDDEEEEEDEEEGKNEVSGGTSAAWFAFVAEAEARELSDHTFAISFVNKYGDNTHSTIEKLRNKLKLGTGKRKRGEGAGGNEDYAENANEECTIQLSTVHGAKGLEWDTVQLLDDLAPLAAFRVVDDEVTGTPSGSPWFMQWDDQSLNLWYVALTRAKKQLIVPDKVLGLLNALAALLRCADERGVLRDPLPVGPTWHDNRWVYVLPPFSDVQAAEKFKHRNVAIPQLFNKDDLELLVADIALPLREEFRRLASGVPRLEPPLPEDLCLEDVLGVRADEPPENPFQDENELARQAEAYERCLLGPDAGLEREAEISGVPGVKPEPRGGSDVKDLRRTRSYDMHGRGEDKRLKRSDDAKGLTQ